MKPYRCWLICILLSCLAIIVGCAKHDSQLANDSNDSKPLLVINSPSNVIEVEIGEKKQISLDVEYVGQIPVDIQLVDAGCGCRRATVNPEHLEPQSRATIDLVYDASRATQGSSEFSITMITKDGRKIEAAQPIQLIHQNNIHFSDRRLRFEEITASQSVSRTIELSWLKSMEVSEVSASTTSDNFTIERLQEFEASGWSEPRCAVKFVVNLLPQKSVHAFADELFISLYSEDKERRDFSIPISVDMIGEVKYEPTTVFAGVLRLGEPKTFRIDFSSRTGESPLVIESVDGPRWVGMSYGVFQGEENAIVDVTLTPIEIKTASRIVHVIVQGTIGEEPFSLQIPCVIVPIQK